MIETEKDGWNERETQGEKATERKEWRERDKKYRDTKKVLLKETEL